MLLAKLAKTAEPKGNRVLIARN